MNNLAPAIPRGFASPQPKPTTMLPRPAIWIIPVVSLALGSCAPNAAVEPESTPPVAGQETKPEAEPEAEPEVQPEPVVAAVPDDGIRLPDMLALPGENEFRKPPPSASQGSGSGAVIARPPSE